MRIDSKIIDKNDDYQLLYKEEKYMNFTLFEEILSHENVLSAFEKCFDSICQNWDKIFNSIQPSWELSNPWTFYDKLFTQSDRIIFLGMTLFLEKNDFEETKFKQWMRVVWNLVENTDIADTSSMVGVMKLIVELSINSNNIYEFLADNINQINSSSSKNAVGEERIKSGFIKSDPKWEYLFINVEKHSFFRGSIGFIITDSMEINEFTHRVDMAFKVFDNNGVNNEYQKAGHIFLRALISRYTDNSLIGQNFTDTDESEHYLKKMLSSNEIVRSATIEWFSLTDENELKKKLNEEVSKDSHIPGWLVNNDREKNRIRSAHEALYKKPDLQIWMQQKKAIRFAWNYSHLWVSKPRSWYKWVMIDSFRNEIINKLINIKGFTTDNSCKYNINDKEFQIPYYWGIYNIEVIRDEVKLIFDKEDSVTIYRIKNEQWTEIKKIDLDKCITKITIKNNNNNDL